MGDLEIAVGLDAATAVIAASPPVSVGSGRWIRLRPLGRRYAAAGDLAAVVALRARTRYADWLTVDDEEAVMLLLGGWPLAPAARLTVVSSGGTEPPVAFQDPTQILRLATFLEPWVGWLKAK